MFTRLVVTRIAFHPIRKNEVLFAEITFFMQDGTKLQSINFSGKLLPYNIREGREVFLTLERPKTIEDGG